jgi:Xaa-Pro aminopeptidase
LTIEPGIYIAEDLEGVDSRYLGIGVRIEDDVLVTSEGNEVLSSRVPKSVEEIEAALGA